MSDLELNKELMRNTTEDVKKTMELRMQLHKMGHEHTREVYPLLGDIVVTNLEVLYKLAWAHGVNAASDYIFSTLR